MKGDMLVWGKDGAEDGEGGRVDGEVRRDVASRTRAGLWGTSGAALYTRARRELWRAALQGRGLLHFSVPRVTPGR